MSLSMLRFKGSFTIGMAFMVGQLTSTACEMFPASGIPVAYTNRFEY